jgi:hypothetical protein
MELERMAESPFHDQLSLEDQAVRFGKQAVELGLIPSFGYIFS